MGFDPIMMALIKKEASGLPVIAINTPLSVNEDFSSCITTLTNEEERAIVLALQGARPAIVYFTIPAIAEGAIACVANIISAVGFSCSFCGGGALIEVTIGRDNDRGIATVTCYMLQGVS